MMKRYLSLGVGVQSSTLALMIEHGDLPPVDAAIFSDTLEEPRPVYAWLEWLRSRLSYPVHVVGKGTALGADSLRLRKSATSGQTYIKTLIPAFHQTPNGLGLLGRKCTADYKVAMLLRKQRQLAEVPNGCKEVRVETLMGISYDEVYRVKASRVPWAVLQYPLVDLRLSRLQCAEWMVAHGYPVPPRSACKFCPYHSDDEWQRLKQHDPQDFAEAVQFDYALREAGRQCTGTARLSGDLFLHRSLKPLDQVDFNTDGGQVDMFNNECEGLCGI